MKAGKIVLAAFIVIFLIISISPAWAAKDKLEFAFVTNGPYTFWTFAHAGIMKAEKDFNVKVHFYKPPSGAPEEQKRFIETMLAKKIDGLAWCVVDPDNMTPFLNQIAKRLPVITFDSDAIESDRLAYVGMSSYAAGRMCGKGIMHELPDGGEIIIFVGRMDVQNAIERRQGIIDELSGKPYVSIYPGEMSPQERNIKAGKWTILDTRTDGGDESKAKAQAEDAITKYPEVDAMTGLWSYNPPAIINALKHAGKLGKIKQVHFDEEGETLQAIRDGHVYATVVQNPYEYGRKSIEILYKLATKQDAGIPENRLVGVPARVITKENVEEFWTDLKEKLKTGESAEVKAATN